MENFMYLSSYSFVEPEEPLHLYYPSWLNVWESYSYKNALKNTGANGWGFKRFGTMPDAYIREVVRKPHYMPYIDAMEKASNQALYGLLTKERMHLLKSRTAFIYVDSWGESASFEKNISALHTSVIDTLPKNLIKKFSVSDATCKIRGEKNAFLQAMRMAQDYLNWDIFEFVIVCGAYRAVPLLEFTAECMDTERIRKTERSTCINISVERIGCFIFSKRESALKISCGSYVADGNNKLHNREQFAGSDNELLCYAGRYNQISPTSNPHAKTIDLVQLYGSSGCLTPALGWQYISDHCLREGKMRTILPDEVGGYNFFDTWY